MPANYWEEDTFQQISATLDFEVTTLDKQLVVIVQNCTHGCAEALFYCARDTLINMNQQIERNSEKYTKVTNCKTSTCTKMQSVFE